jgi:hypothetical protein
MPRDEQQSLNETLQLNVVTPFSQLLKMDSLLDIVTINLRRRGNEIKQMKVISKRQY